ncbi:hypothetical protein [Cytobacillus firmus]|uniref:hypothetical protein n=1 Tax=Cytobacillus firmus TaxID=1399 RepID=UPI0018CFBA38|nr:hypothetical protein [Cytobacillus firmus]MBG9447291.1 hypothetical protein [Cytobacillus firmus]
MHTETLVNDWVKPIPKEDIVRKIFICYPTKAFQGREEIGFQIFDDISRFFNIPYNSVQVVGSAKTGKSYFKFTEFIEGESDLDIAIISPELYLEYMELSYKITKGYTDQSKFGFNRQQKSNVYEFKKCISNGIFRPDLMPNCPEKSKWWAFFNKLSNKHNAIFKNINAGIYATQYFFEFKQIEGLKKYMERIGGTQL